MIPYRRIHIIPRLAALGLVLLAVVALIALASVRSTSRHTAIPGRHDTPTARATPPRTAGTPEKSGDPSGTTGAASTPADEGSACSVLTPALAGRLLQATAPAQSTTPDPVVPATSDTTHSSCTYTSGTASVSLSIRSPSSTLGISENTVPFGSDRPAGAVPVQGYGQTAYWDPATNHLNILAHNDWYAISRSSALQADCQVVADALRGNF